MKTFAQQQQPARASYPLQQQQKGPDIPKPEKATQAAPPVTERTTEVVAAQDKARTDAARRKGYKASILAGETGGYGADQPGKKSLLGQ